MLSDFVMLIIFGEEFKFFKLLNTLFPSYSYYFLSLSLSQVKIHSLLCSLTPSGSEIKLHPDIKQQVSL